MIIKLLVGACGLLLLSVTLQAAHQCHPDYCFPTDSCYPNLTEKLNFAKSLDCDILDPSDPLYQNLTILKDLVWIEFPAYIVMVKSVEDVQKTMLMAKRFNLKLSIQSSGHDYNGRSTATGSLQINLKNMRGIDIDLNSPLNADGVIRVESGNNWVRVYEEVDKVGRIVVGGSAHTVAMGGYTLGGGHSPLSPSLGLAVDNLLMVQMVTADGAVVNASANGTESLKPDGTVTRSSDSELFWALRGGGGGTFGVATSFVFKLHKPPSGFATISCHYRFHMTNQRDEAKTFLNHYFDLLKTLPDNWGGYMLSGHNYSIPTFQHTAYTVHMLHYGDASLPSFAKMTPLMSFHPEWLFSPCTTDNYATFWEYEKNVVDSLYKWLALAGTLLSPADLNSKSADTLVDLLSTFPTNTSSFGCTSIRIGGKVSAAGDDDTAVSSGFRAARSCMSCSVLWEINTQEGENLAASFAIQDRLRLLGHGVYINEPSTHLPHWKTDFWGTHYERLLRVKKAWDPDNFLTCLHCVGSDLGRHYARGHGAGHGQPNIIG